MKDWQCQKKEAKYLWTIVDICSLIFVINSIHYFVARSLEDLLAFFGVCFFLSLFYQFTHIWRLNLYFVDLAIKDDTFINNIQSFLFKLGIAQRRNQIKYFWWFFGSNEKITSKRRSYKSNHLFFDAHLINSRHSQYSSSSKNKQSHWNQPISPYNLNNFVSTFLTVSLASWSCLFFIYIL